jgi:hypothetical protein
MIKSRYILSLINQLSRIKLKKGGLSANILVKYDKQTKKTLTTGEAVVK